MGRLAEVAILLALAVIAVIGYKLAPQWRTGAETTLPPVADCDLHRGPCRSGLPGGGSLSLEIAPRPIPVVRSLQVRVRLEGIEAARVEIDFAGVSMDMGPNRRPLAAAGGGLYQGEAALPVCVSGRMQWRATLLVDTAQGRLAVPYLFEAPLEAR
jgi:hypothetical protein